MSSRAGSYSKHIRGYRAFIPKALPPDPPLSIEGDLAVLLAAAERALGRLDGSTQILPNPDLFVQMYVRSEAVLSSQIEGTQSSLHDVLAAEANIASANQPDDVHEVRNYVRAMNHGLGRLSVLPVSVRLIREIHAKLLEGVRGSHLTPGELRTSQNWIGPEGATLQSATFVPPPPEEVPDHLGKWELFLHEDTHLPLLVKIGLAHAQFETIHPFLDGNGRTGRLLITFLLCENGILVKPVLYLSRYFHKNRSEYYDQLQSVRDRGTWEEWITFFLRGVEEVSGQATAAARTILELREGHQRTIAEQFGSMAGNGHRVLEELYKAPIIDVKRVRKIISASSYPAANTLVAKMVECGILREFTGQARNRKFIYQKYVDVFLAA